MWEEVIKHRFKNYIINDNDLIPHYRNPRTWARFDINWDRRSDRAWKVIRYMWDNKKLPDWEKTIFDVDLRVLFISDKYELVEKAFKRFNKKRFDLAEIETVEFKGTTYHIIWD